MFHDETTRKIWLSVAKTMHFMQCLDVLEDDEHPRTEPYMCPEWVARDYAARRKHWDPEELAVREVPLSAFRAALRLVQSTLALSWDRREQHTSLKLPSSFEGVPYADDPEVFGYKLAMQARGHGVGLHDFYPDPPCLRVPDAEYYGPHFEIDERFA